MPANERKLFYNGAAYFYYGPLFFPFLFLVLGRKKNKAQKNGKNNAGRRLFLFLPLLLAGYIYFSPPFIFIFGPILLFLLLPRPKIKIK